MPRKSKSKKSRKSNKSTKKSTKKSVKPSTKNPHEKVSVARSDMNMTDLQFMARSRGIPFGGLTKERLIKKINEYY